MSNKSELKSMSEHEDKNLQLSTGHIIEGVAQIIQDAQRKVSVYLNATTTITYWNIGNYINSELRVRGMISYGSKILATLSQHLTQNFGKGYTYTALTRMCKVADIFEAKIIATLSQQLSWSHLIELAAIENESKRDFFTQLSVYENWGVRQLR